MLAYLLVTWLVTTISLLILARLPLGIEIDKFSTALWAAVAIGLCNALIRPVLLFLTFPITFLTLGLFALVVNGLVFALAASLVPGFRIRGCLGALLGPLVLSCINAILLRLLSLGLRGA